MWFIPSSALTEDQRNQMPHQVATRMPNAFYRVVRKLNSQYFLPEYKIDDLILSEKQLAVSNDLGNLFLQYGSDKSTTHNYHLIYGSILSLISENPRILEIGLGSNDPSIASNMGIHGKPGASLRAFKKYKPSSIIDGADIDSTIKVEECRVFHIDQTVPESFGVINGKGEPFYDLIIDDGLHSPDANLYTLEFALGSISNNGFIVIEDINESSLFIWKSLQYYLKATHFNSYLIKTRAAWVFLVTKNLYFPKLRWS